ncbi:MAG: Ig-like domain-containing protein [Chitinophaga sp.]
MNQNMRGWTVVSLLVLAIFSFFTRCANIVPPGGGPRDTLPPRLVNVTPADSTLRFKSNKVVFHFNEYVELDNVIEKLIVSPNMKRTPVITAKLRVVTLEIKDSLQPNTTYTFNFGDAVKDVNERNPIVDFQYVVSTGDYMDSLELTGKVIVAETGKPDSNIAVMLYGNLEDSVVSKEKPLYLAKSKGDGSYRFRNLKPGTYRLFALKEEDRDYQYTQPEELIAFSDSLIRLDGNISDRNLSLFNEVDTATLYEDEPEVTEPEPERRNRDKDKKPRKPRLQVGFNLNGGQQELGDSLIMNFNFPIRTLDTLQIGLYEDTTRKKVPFTLHPADTTAKSFKIAYDWKPGKPYEIILPAGFATDTSGLQTAKADTVSFTAKSLDDYGTVKVDLSISDSARNVLPQDDTSYQLVVQLVSGTDIKYSGVAIDGKWERGLIQPGEYQIRVVADHNKNGVWDTGSYYGVPRKQPEIVFSFKEPINIKKNWTVSPSVKL